VRISKAQIGQIIKVYKAQGASRALTSGLEPAKAASKDSMKLTVNQGDIEKVNEQVKKLPDLRQDRIQELAQAVRDGTYKVDPTEVADRMMGRLLADKIK